jgi:hypothetical protein
VRTREHVHARDGEPAEQAPERPGLAKPERGIGVERPAVDDPEGATVPRGRRRSEVARVEAVRDRDDAAVAKLGEGAPEALDRLGCVHHDRGGGLQDGAHAPTIGEAVEGRRVEPHLVQRPRVLELRDPRNAERPGDLGDPERRLVGPEFAQDDRDVPAPVAADADDRVDPPADERPPTSENPVRPLLQRAENRLWARNPDDLDSGDLGEHRGILGSPPVLLGARSREDERANAALGQVPRQLDGALNSCASDGREVVRDEKGLQHELERGAARVADQGSRGVP